MYKEAASVFLFLQTNAKKYLVWKNKTKIKRIGEVLETTLRPCLIKQRENAKINKLSGNECFISYAYIDKYITRGKSSK